jgi:diguanylate cyclase (GGDEF)-like protein
LSIFERLSSPAARPGLATLLVFLLLYYLVARWGVEAAGLRYAAVSMVWPASGVGLAIALRFGARIWPLLLMASALATWPTIASVVYAEVGGRIGSALLIGAAGALEAALAAWLTHRLAGDAYLQRPGAFLLTVLVAWPAACVLACFLLVLGSLLGGMVTVAHWAGFALTWYSMAVADLIGMMAITFPVCLWLRRPQLGLSRRGILELGVYVALGVLALTLREPLQPLYLLFVVHLAIAVRMPLAVTATAVAVTSSALLLQAKAEMQATTAPPPYEVFLTVLSFPLALTLASYTTALLWREVQQHQQLLEARVAERTRELERANARLQKLSRTDALTGAWNRRYFEHRAQRELERAAAHGSSVGFLLVDLDDFKGINDRHGHPAGDVILMEVVNRWGDELRPTDVLARIGGEEFAVLLPECTVAYARDVAERLRSITAAAAVQADDAAVAVTISVGVAVIEPGASGAEDGRTALDAALRTADSHLYRAKRVGRNRVVG